MLGGTRHYRREKESKIAMENVIQMYEKFSKAKVFYTKIKKLLSCDAFRFEFT